MAPAKHSRSRHTVVSCGVTLIELVVVLLVVGILASLAVPTFRAQVLAANRTDAREALLALAAAQEKFYLACNTYAALLDPDRESSCDPPRLRFVTHSQRGLYTITVETADVGGWTARATVASGTPQAADGSCEVLELDSTGTRTARMSAGAPARVDCWAR
jgi:type IV pilus assembly protein PilE